MPEPLKISQCKKRVDQKSFLTRKVEVSVMKKVYLALIAVCMGLAFVALVTVKAEAAAIKLTYSNFFPATHIQSKLVDSWCREVETRTKGRVNIKHYPGQTLTKAGECYEGVVKGRSDLGLSVFSYTQDRFPVMGTVDLPLGYISGKVATAVANELYEKFRPKELSDSKVMYLHAHGPALVNTRGKPIRRLEDMKGLKFGTTGAAALIIKALGGIPVSVPMPECYQLIKSGKANGSTHPLESHKGWKLAEVENYITAAYSISYTTTFFVIMNKDKWSTLPQDIKVIIEETNNEWLLQHGEAWDTIDEEGMRYFLDRGGRVVGLDADEAARWKMAVAPIIEDYVKILNEKGLNGQEIVDFTIKTLNSMQ
jgi:TRAP-type C4-dicarboxylate transport system substrate-binding protein